MSLNRIIQNAPGQAIVGGDGMRVGLDPRRAARLTPVPVQCTVIRIHRATALVAHYVNVVGRVRHERQIKMQVLWQRYLHGSELQ